MAVRKINESTLTAIADAIRAKTGGSALINPEDMASEIDGLLIGGKITNLINGLPLSSGYINQNGTIGAADGTRKEVYTAKFDVTPNDFIITIVKVPVTNRTHWCALGFYTEEDEWVSRIAPYNSGTNITMGGAVQVPSNAHKASMSFRSYGDCEAAAFAVSELMTLTDMYQITR